MSLFRPQPKAGLKGKVIPLVGDVDDDHASSRLKAPVSNAPPTLTKNNIVGGNSINKKTKNSISIPETPPGGPEMAPTGLAGATVVGGNSMPQPNRLSYATPYEKAYANLQNQQSQQFHAGYTTTTQQKNQEESASEQKRGSRKAPKILSLEEKLGAQPTTPTIQRVVGDVQVLASTGIRAETVSIGHTVTRSGKMRAEVVAPGCVIYAAPPPAVASSNGYQSATPLSSQAQLHQGSAKNVEATKKRASSPVDKPAVLEAPARKVQRRDGNPCAAQRCQNTEWAFYQDVNDASTWCKGCWNTKVEKSGANKPLLGFPLSLEEMSALGVPCIFKKALDKEESK